MHKVNIVVYVDTKVKEEAVHVANLLRGHMNNVVTNPQVVRAEVNDPEPHDPEALRDDTVHPAGEASKVVEE